jgi:O-antigen/teichoic acid export membrane protein
VKMYYQTRSAVGRVLQGDSLRARATRGGAWLGSGSFIEQACRFGRNMLLARILAPSAFGAMAIVLSSASLIATLSDVGVLPAIIQNPRGANRAYLNAAWWMGMVRAICMYAVIFVAAPWIARFYGNADLSALFRVALLSIVLDGMLSPHAKLAHKEMKFGRWAIISNGGAICGVILTIALSFVLRDVWALAIGYCSENAFRCLFSYVLYPVLPSTNWDKHVFQDILKFSKGMVGLSFLNLIFARTDIFVLGKLYSPATLGIYAMAVTLVQTPSSFLINMLSQTIMPALSHVQGDNERMNRIVSEVTSWTILLGLPAVVTVCTCGSSLLKLTYGARYTTAVGALAVAAGVVFLNTLNSLITNLFFAVGRPALHRRAVIASAITMLIVIYPACKYFGLVGGQISGLIAIIASYVIQIVRAHEVTGLGVLRYGKVFILAGLVSAGIVGVGFGARFFGLTTKPLSSIAIAGAACMLAYLLSVPIFVSTRKIA